MRMMIALVILLGGIAGCSDDETFPLSGHHREASASAPGDPATDPSVPGGPADQEATTDDALKGLPTGEAQRQIVCARGGTNRLTQALCGAAPATIGSLAQLQAAVGLSFTSDRRDGNPGFALTGHSSSLVARSTSSINPRAIVFDAPSRDRIPNFVTMGFVRGDQFAEIAARDPEQSTLRFFLVSFKQACNDSHCKPGDLLTPAVERNWTSVSVYEDVDIKNTIFDCTHCHQSAGTTTPKMLRFQELRFPWTHFFRDNTAGNQLVADFQAAHGTNEDYGPIPASQIRSSEPQDLEDLLRDNGFGNQPNEFPTRQIEREVENGGASRTWDGLYANFVEGKAIAPPYFGLRVTDPAKLATMTKAYRSFVDGQLAAADLPDIREAFLDSAAHEMGFAAKPGLNGAQLLTQMCTSCHNPNLDPTITRARFDVTKLATLDRAEKDKAIARIKLAPTNPLRMPPALFRSLSPDEIALVEQELKK